MKWPHLPIFIFFSFMLFSFYAFDQLEKEFSQISLFSPPPIPNAVMPLKNHRFSEIYFENLEKNLEGKERGELILNLFSHLNFKSLTQQIIYPQNSDGPITFLGHLEGPNGKISSQNGFSILEYYPKKKLITGLVRAEGKEYNIATIKNLQIEKSSNGRARRSIVVIQENQLKDTKDQLMIPIDKESIPKIKGPQISSRNSPSSPFFIIDILLLYTSTAKENHSHIENQMLLELASTNLYLAQSGAKARLRAVHVEEISFNESGNGQNDLNRLTALPDKEVHLSSEDKKIQKKISLLRNKYGADLVTLWVANSNLCGIAWAQTIPDSSLYGISIKKIGCDSLTFAHEIGHNLGLGHDRFVEKEGEADMAADFGRGHGHIDLKGRFRTLMSYEDKCLYYKIPCERIPFFASPHNYYRGRPMGISGISDTVSVINQNAPMIANYYPTKIEPEMALSDSYKITLATQLNDKEDGISKACFIATFAYDGETLHPHINRLRAFRDHFILPLPLGIGEFLIKSYYKISPELIKKMPQSPLIKKISRFFLSPFIYLTGEKIWKFSTLFSLLIISITFIMLISSFPFFRFWIWALIILILIAPNESKAVPTLDPFSPPYLPTHLAIQNNRLHSATTIQFIGIGAIQGKDESHLNGKKIDSSLQDFSLPIIVSGSFKNSDQLYQINFTPIHYQESSNNENIVVIENKKNEHQLLINYTFSAYQNKKIQLFLGTGFQFNFNHLTRANQYRERANPQYEKDREYQFYQELNPSMTLIMNDLFFISVGPILHFLISSHHVQHSYFSEKIGAGIRSPLNDNFILKSEAGIEHKPAHRKIGRENLRGHEIFEENPYFIESELAFSSLAIKYQYRKGKEKKYDEVSFETQKIFFSLFQKENKKERSYKNWRLQVEASKGKKVEGINEKKEESLGMYLGIFL